LGRFGYAIGTNRADSEFALKTIDGCKPDAFVAAKSYEIDGKRCKFYRKVYFYGESRCGKSRSKLNVESAFDAWQQEENSDARGQNFITPKYAEARTAYTAIW